MHYPPVEKEATAIIEAVRKWKHLLGHFTIITDQRSVAFMLDNRNRTKIKKKQNSRGGIRSCLKQLHIDLV